MKNIKQEKGITLIALVITIIVLLILAGVAISMLSGENGILKQAAEAKKQTENQSFIEQVKIAIMGAMINEDVEAKENELVNGLKSLGIEEENIVSYGNGEYLVINGTDRIIINSDCSIENGDEVSDIDIELQKYFDENNLEYKCRYGYVTGVNVTVSKMQSDLQAGGYELKAIDGTDNFTDNIVTTGMEIHKDGNKLANTVVYGELYGEQDLGAAMRITLKMDGVDEELQGAHIVAADVNHDGELNGDDVRIILKASSGAVVIEQNIAAINPDKIICHTNDEWRTKYTEIIKERFKDTKYTIECNDTGKEYVLKGGTEGTTAREILDIINEENIYIKNEDTNKKVKEEEVISNNAEDFYFYYEVQEEDKRVNDIDLYFRIDFT